MVGQAVRIDGGRQRILPVIQTFEEGGFGVFKMGQRRWEDSDLLEEFESKSEAEEFMKKLD